MKRIYQYWQKIPKIFRNEYIAALAAFVLWLLFFDHNNVFNQLQTRSELRKLNQQRRFYKNEIANINQTKEALFTQPASLERFARERYLMKKDKEDIFIIEKDTVSK